MENEDKEILLVMLDILDKIRKNTEMIAKGRSMASNDKRVDKLLGRERLDKRSLDDRI